jgi:hypothetical protein
LAHHSLEFDVVVASSIEIQNIGVVAVDVNGAILKRFHTFSIII